MLLPEAWVSRLGDLPVEDHPQVPPALVLLEVPHLVPREVPEPPVGVLPGPVGEEQWRHSLPDPPWPPPSPAVPGLPGTEPDPVGWGRRSP